MEYCQVLHEWICKYGHIKYGEYEPEICNIWGYHEFKLVAKNAGAITKDGFTKTPRDDSNKE